MSTTTQTLDWLELFGELSLSRTAAQFAQAVESAADRLGADDSRVYLYSLEDNQLSRFGPPPETLAVEAGSLPGQCAMYCEPVQEGGKAAVPLTRFGSLVGVLVSQGGPFEELQELGRLAGLVYEQVRSREEAAAYQASSQELLARAADKLAPGGHGHVERVARVATELASLMDLSPQSRQEIWDAAHYHDVGWLVLEGRPYEEIVQEHGQAGADFLAASQALVHLVPLVENHHRRYDSPDRERVPMEAWVLALAEDLDEFWSTRKSAGFRANTGAFYKERAPGHHPEVVDALSGLIDSGKLEEIYS